MPKKIGLSKWQKEVWNDPHRYKVINCGRRAGKSFLCSIKLLAQATEQPNQECWYISPTFRQSKQIMWKMLQDLIPKEAIEKTNETELYFRLKNGSTIYLKGASDPDTLRGVKIDLAIFDEVAFFDHWSEVYMIMRPTLMDSEADMWMISTPNGFNHFKDLFDNNIPEVNKPIFPPDSHKAYHYTTYDNPYISDAEIENTKYTMTENQFAQEMLGEFRKMEGLIYPDFDRDFHVRSIPDFQAVYWLMGLDRGYNNPTAVSLIAVDKDGGWYQVDEIYKPGLTNPMLSVELQDMLDSNNLTRDDFDMMTMDSAQAGDISELSDLGWAFIPVSKTSGESKENYVRWKISKFAQRLKVNDGKAKFYIHPRCKYTIKEFETYHWKKRLRDDDDKQEKPDKKNDHSMDNLSDLNVMFLHHFKEIKKNPWDGKLKGTYIPPDPADIEVNEDEDFTETIWQDDFH